MTMFFGVILLSAHLLIASTAPVVPDQVGCAEGEPSVGDTEPIVNLTVLPSLNITELSRFSVICDATSPSGVSRALPPIKIIIYIGKFNVLECGENKTPIYQCVYTLDTFFPDLPRMVSCTAVNADQECRFDTATITLVKATPTPELTTTELPYTPLPAENMTTTMHPSTEITARNMTTSPASTPTSPKGNTTPIINGGISLTSSKVVTLILFATLLATFT